MISILARVQISSQLDREYLRIGTRYHQLENGFAIYEHSPTCLLKLVNVGIQAQAKNAPSSKLLILGWTYTMYGTIFCRLWTKVQHVKQTSMGIFIDCNAVFRLITSCSSGDIRD